MVSLLVVPLVSSSSSSSEMERLSRARRKQDHHTLKLKYPEIDCQVAESSLSDVFRYSNGLVRVQWPYRVPALVLQQYKVVAR